MPHVSKKKLNQDVLDGISVQLTKIFKLSFEKESTELFVEEFFTNTEKIMLAKRLSVILLLGKGMPQDLICEKLKMSPSTISKISFDLKRGKYDSILNIADKDQNRILNTLANILIDNLPGPFGRSRRGGYGSIYRDH